MTDNNVILFERHNAVKYVYVDSVRIRRRSKVQTAKIFPRRDEYLFENIDLFVLITYRIFQLNKRRLLTNEMMIEEAKLLDHHRTRYHSMRHRMILLSDQLNSLR